MSYIIHIITYLSVIFSISYMASGQIISLFNIDPSSYPIIHAKFLAFDNSGNRISPNINDLIIKENSIPRNIISVICPPIIPPKVLSSALVIDISGSMKRGAGSVSNINLAKAAANAWIQGLPQGNSECAISSFDNKNFLNQDFTSDRNVLLQAVSQLQPVGGTDYDMALLNPPAGGLHITKRGKYQKIIVFLTDGGPNRPPNVASMVAEAKAQQCIIYCVTLGMAAPQCLKDIANQTGGLVFEKVTTIQEAEEIYKKILFISQQGDPCEIIWESGRICQEDAKQVTDVELDFQNTSDDGFYHNPNAPLPSISVIPSTIAFGRKKPGKFYDTTITISVKNADFTINAIKKENQFSCFSVLGNSFPLIIPKNTSKTLTLRCYPLDSTLNFSPFTLESDYCPGYFSASCGFPGKRSSSESLRLIHPNGGEVFVVGCDTLIQWTGIGKKDTVILELSRDNGNTWSILTDKASNLEYSWSKVSRPASNQCLVRVRQNPLRVGATPLKIKTLTGHNSSVNSIIWSYDGLKLASAVNGAGTIKIWNTITGLELRSINGLPNGAYTLSFSPDALRLAVGCPDNSIKIYNVANGVLLKTFLGHSKPVSDIAWSPNGVKIASASFDKTVKIWLDSTGLEQYTLIGHTDSISCIGFSKDSKRIASGSYDGTIKIWHSDSGTILRTLTSHTNKVNSLSWCPDGRLTSCSVDKTIKVWDAGSGGVIRTILTNNGIPRTVTFSSDGSTIAAGFIDGSLHLYDSFIGVELMPLYGHIGSILDAEWSPDATRIATCGADKTVKIWDIDIPYLQNDISDAEFSIVEPIPAGQDVHMLQCLLGSSKDSLIINEVTNLGSFPFTVKSIQFKGIDSAAFELVSGFPPFMLKGNSNQDIEYRFTPLHAGYHKAEMFIITQSDTLKHIIDGEGIIPSIEVIGNIIDFDSVHIGDWKDSIQAITIKNISSIPITIANIRNSGPNYSDFSILSPPGTFTLQPGDTNRLNLRYTARSIGRTSGQLSFDYNAIGSPAIVQLFGEGYGLGALLEAQTQPLELLCNSMITDTLYIKNKGLDTLKVSNISIEGNNKSEFSLLSSIPFNIPSNQSVQCVFEFKPIDIGSKSAEFRIYSNSELNPTYVLPIKAKKELIDFILSTDTIDIGILCPNEKKDTSFRVKNTGSIPFTFFIESQNINAMGQTYVWPGDSVQVLLYFKGSSINGYFYETITIKDTNCLLERKVVLKGFIGNPTISAQKTYDLGSIPIGISKQFTISAVNASGRIIIADNPTLLQFPFTFIGMNPSKGSMILPGDSLHFIIECVGVLGKQQSLLDWNSTYPCLGTAFSDIIVEGKNFIDTISTTIAIQDIIGKPGEKTNIIMYIKDHKNYDLLPANRPFRASIKLNNTILFVQDSSKQTKLDQYHSQLLFSGFAQDKDTLLSIPSVLTVGVTERAPIELLSFDWLQTTKPTLVTRIDGFVSVKDICDSGGVRLYIPGNTMSSLTSRPNPADETLHISFGLAENIQITIDIVNSLGQTITNIINNTNYAIGEHSVFYNISTLNNGLYFLRMQSKRGILQSRFDIIH